MPWTLSVTSPAKRQLRDLPEHDRKAIGQALSRLETEPGSVDLAKLAGRNQWRLRVGRWRVFLELDNVTGTIYVTAVRQRNEGTYR